jgi:methylmalonyl-CoA mutase C-terminal domain/subunit
VTETQGKIRVIVAKAGLDGHDRGAKVVARALRDGGVEVIYTGLHQTPEQIVAAAIQEDVDAVGLSVLSGAHMTLFPRVVELLKESGADDIVVFGGGIIPDADIAALTAQGVAKIFTPGASTKDIVAWVNDVLAPATRLSPGGTTPRNPPMFARAGRDGKRRHRIAPGTSERMPRQRQPGRTDASAAPARATGCLGSARPGERVPRPAPGRSGGRATT